MGLVAVLAALLGGCTTVSILNASSIVTSPGVSIARDIAYGPEARQRLDVYAPSSRMPGRPVVVFFYGGSWDSGAKADYAWVGRALADRGYVAVVADYRLYPAVVWPAFLKDSALAVRWARDHASEYGGDASRLVLMGHSAGAYNAVDLALDRRWLDAVGIDPSRDVRAVIGLSGPYDFLPLRSDELKTIFGPADQRPDTQPINHVDGRSPPLLLITGDRDTTVDPGNSDRLAARVEASGGQVKVLHYPKLDHVRTVGALAPPLRWLAPVMADAAGFIDQQTGFRPGSAQ
jgi:acetyl esterase/lipase